jgi:hypothetical protein
MVQQATATATGQYIYAIVAAADSQTIGKLRGIDGGEVYPISGSRVAAIVSDVPARRIRPERRHLAAHQAALQQLMHTTTMLPVAFGIIADGPIDVRRTLLLNQEELQEQLRRVAGCVEMGLRVTWDVPNIFEYLVNTHVELRDARDRLFRGGREPSREDKIELGRLCERVLNQERNAHTEQVLEALRPHCAEIRENKPRDEREIVHLACLVDRGARAEFEQAVVDAATPFDANYRFDYNGPWPPHHFVDVALRL